MTPYNSTLCPQCKVEADTNHLLLHCALTAECRKEYFDELQNIQEQHDSPSCREIIATLNQVCQTKQPTLWHDIGLIPDRQAEKWIAQMQNAPEGRTPHAKTILNKLQMAAIRRAIHAWQMYWQKEEMFNYSTQEQDPRLHELILQREAIHCTKQALKCLNQQQPTHKRKRQLQQIHNKKQKVEKDTSLLNKNLHSLTKLIQQRRDQLKKEKNKKTPFPIFTPKI